MVHCSAIYGEIFSHHDLENHDECGTRLKEALKGVPEGVPVIAPCCASETDLLRVHTSSHIRMIREFSSHGGNTTLIRTRILTVRHSMCPPMQQALP